MNEPADRVAVACPSCSPSGATVHEVLTATGGMATVRCADCGHVHKEALPSEQSVERSVVVSQDSESFRTTVEIPADETLVTGEEFVLETDEAIHEVRITDLQVGPEKRAAEATGEEVSTVWTRAVDNVSVNVTVNPADGRDDTRSVTLYVPGDYTFEVGSEETFGEESFEVTGIHTRDDASGYRFDKLDHAGDAAFAKDIKRVYATAAAEPRSAWSGW